MTHQISEFLERDAGAPALPKLRLYGVYAGDMDHPGPRTRYPALARPDPSKIVHCTALWRGHVSSYCLTSEGTLVLRRLEYPFTDDAAPDEVNETLQGDFWLDMRESFLGDSTRVQFRKGRIVEATEGSSTEGGLGT